MADIDPAAVMAEHRNESTASWTESGYARFYCWGCKGDEDEPCLPYRLAEALATERAKLARVAMLARERCETYSEGRRDTCADEPLWQEGDYYGRAPNAPYLANRYCPPCRVRAALADPPTTDPYLRSIDA